MPSHFDRFRLLNGGSRIRNESDKNLFIKSEEPEEGMILSPGMEMDLPYSPIGEVIVEVENIEV